MKRILVRRTLAGTMGALCLSLLFAGCASLRGDERKPITDAHQQFEAEANQFFKKNKIDEISACLVDTKGQDTFWSAGNTKKEGIAAKAEPVGPDTVLAVGSVSKVLMPIAIMKLVERGAMDLDAPVSRYIPEFTLRSPSSSADTVTIRSLLCHASGLESDIIAGFFQKETDYRSIVGLLNKSKLTNEPWTQYSYSNPGYSLLAVAVERASGTDYPRFIKDEILIPWGMRDSGFAFVDERLDVTPIRDLPAGLFCSTARDMSLLIRGLLADREGKGVVLKAESVAEIWKEQNGLLKNDDGFKTGLTFMLHPVPSLGIAESCSHGGDIPPYAAQLYFDPFHGLGVFIVSKAKKVDSTGLIPLAEAGLRSELLARGETITPMIPPASPRVAVDAALKDRLTGYYNSVVIGMFKITSRDDGLFTSIDGQTLRIYPHADGTLEFEELFLGFLPHKTGRYDTHLLRMDTYEGKPVLSLIIDDFVNPTGPAIKLERQTLTPAWKKRLGSWHMNMGANSPPAAGILTYDKNSGTLVFPGWMVLKIINDGELRTYGIGRGQGEYLEAGEDEKGDWMRFSGIEFRR